MSGAVPSASCAEIGVFAKGTRNRHVLPSYRITREDAQHMVDCGVAHWVNSRRHSIQMDFEATAFKIRDLSAQMGPAVIEAAVAGSRHHQALVAAWESASLPIAA